MIHSVWMKVARLVVLTTRAERELISFSELLMFVNRTLAFALVIAAAAGPTWPCDCRAPRPACAYVGADAIFLGRVGFTNDDGPGTFVQATLVRFDVEEVFKGLPEGTKEVWADPGSFTSCYENYHLGERYLIVAQRKGQLPRDSATMTVMRGNGKQKPLPPGIDPARPPSSTRLRSVRGRGRQMDSHI